MMLPWVDVTVLGVPIRSSVTPREIGRLQELARGQQVLEVGSAFGFSAIGMALAGAEHVLAVDPHNLIPRSLEEMLHNIQGTGVGQKVTVAVGSSQHLLPALDAAGARFGLIFIDGDHAYGAVRRDLELAAPLLAPGGTLACHDYGEDTCRDVARALDDWVDVQGLDAPEDIVDTLWTMRT